VNAREYGLQVGIVAPLLHDAGHEKNDQANSEDEIEEQHP
jgi:predicted HD phosphohydrolase